MNSTWSYIQNIHASFNNPSGIVSPHQQNVMINVSAIVTVVSLAISHKELKSSCDTGETIARDAREAQWEERESWESWLICNISSSCTYVLSISEVRHYLHVCITCGGCNDCNYYAIRIWNCQCKWEWNCGRVQGGSTMSLLSLWVTNWLLISQVATNSCCAPRSAPRCCLLTAACAGHMWCASHVRLAAGVEEGRGPGRGDPPEARWADCGKYINEASALGIR